MEICTKEIANEFKSESQVIGRERKRILEEITVCNDRISKARILRVEGDLGKTDFEAIKNELNVKLDRLEEELGKLSGKNREINEILEESLMKLKELDKLYIESDVEMKRSIIGSMFPEKLVFDGTRHRTTKVNEGILLIYQKINELGGKKNGTNPCFLDLSHDVIPLGFEPRTHTLKVYCSTS